MCNKIDKSILSMKNKHLPNSSDLLTDLITIIEQGKKQVAIQVNSALTLVFWQVGRRINADILNRERAAYGKQIINNTATNLEKRYGNNFRSRNLRRMLQFAELFPDFEIVSTLSTQLSWSHFIVLFTVKNENSRHFYTKKVGEERWSVRHLQKQIQRKAYERQEIAAHQSPELPNDQKNIFKDPYFLDFLGLKEGYLENDLEAAILKDLELFVLELGMGFTFVERQKRMIIDGEDFHLDLLFFHRKLRRLVAVELKLNKFKAGDKGQMELYLKWLDKYEKQVGENSPIGLILCAEASRETVELLEMHKDGIMVAEYWTELPPKSVLENRLHHSLIEAKERLARKKL